MFEEYGRQRLVSSGIYRIRNLVNNNRYIGSSTKIKSRLAEHRRMLRGNKHDNHHLQFAWNKYGEEAFAFEILEMCCKEDLLIREQFYLPEDKTYRSLKVAGFYNQCPVAGNTLGIEREPHPDSTKKKISKRARGNKYSLGTVRSPEQKTKMSERLKGNLNWRGKKHSEETKKKMSQKAKGNKNNLGKTPSLNNRKRTAERMRGNTIWVGRKHSEETKRKMREAAARRKRKN